MEYILYKALDYVLLFIWYAIIARVIISWIPVQRDNQIIRILYQITEPILTPIRALIQRSSLGRNSMFDFSTLIALILISVLRNAVSRLFIVF